MDYGPRCPALCFTLVLDVGGCGPAVLERVTSYNKLGETRRAS